MSDEFPRDVYGGFYDADGNYWAADGTSWTPGGEFYDASGTLTTPVSVYHPDGTYFDEAGQAHPPEEAAASQEDSYPEESGQQQEGYPAEQQQQQQQQQQYTQQPQHARQGPYYAPSLPPSNNNSRSPSVVLHVHNEASPPSGRRGGGSEAGSVGRGRHVYVQRHSSGAGAWEGTQDGLEEDEVYSQDWEEEHYQQQQQQQQQQRHARGVGNRGGGARSSSSHPAPPPQSSKLKSLSPKDRAQLNHVTAAAQRTLAATSDLAVQNVELRERLAYLEGQARYLNLIVKQQVSNTNLRRAQAGLVGGLVGSGQQQAHSLPLLLRGGGGSSSSSSSSSPSSRRLLQLKGGRGGASSAHLDFQRVLADSIVSLAALTEETNAATAASQPPSARLPVQQHFQGWGQAPPAASPPPMPVYYTPFPDSAAATATATAAAAAAATAAQMQQMQQQQSQQQMMMQMMMQQQQQQQQQQLRQMPSLLPQPQPLFSQPVPHMYSASPVSPGRRLPPLVFPAAPQASSPTYSPPFSFPYAAKLPSMQ